MADIASGDVTYSQKSFSVANPKVSRVFSLVFGDGVLTYPAGGVPLVKGHLGCPNAIESFKFVDMANANGYVYKYDYTNNKIKIYQGDNNNAADAPLIELVSGVAAPAAATLYVEVQGF